MNVRDFENRMRAKGSTLVGTTMHHSLTEYRIHEIDTGSQKVVLFERHRRIESSVYSWKMYSLRYRLVSGFSWVMI